MASEPAAAVQATQQSGSVQPAHSVHPSTKANGKATSTSSFKNLDAFRKAQPVLFNKFMQSLAQNVANECKKGSQRVIKALQNMRRGS